VKDESVQKEEESVCYADVFNFEITLWETYKGIFPKKNMD